jgi:hypothetical protein
MTNIANLYLKWGVFRKLIGSGRSDAQIAKKIFGNTEGASILFSRLLYGDYGCQPNVASELVKVMNLRIDVHREDRKLPSRGAKRIASADLHLPVYEFIRHVIAVAEQIDTDELDAAHRSLLDEIAPRAGKDASPRLVVKRFDRDRSFPPFVGSGGDGPVDFEVGRHFGQLAVEDISVDPVATYAFLARDPHPLGCRLWDLSWRETMLWLPSPFTPARVAKTINLLPTAMPIMPDPGRFLATAVLVLDRKTVAELDPRGPDPAPGVLDEPQTARFLTNMRRLAKRKPASILIATNEYNVVLPQ